MTKQEVVDVVLDGIERWCVREKEITLRLPRGKNTVEMAQEITEAIWCNFILLHQGDKAEVPKSPSTDPTPGGSCARCQTREGFGAMLRIKGDVLLCTACLEGLRKDGVEARQFWERCVVAYAETSSRLVYDTSIADALLDNWLKRFGSRP